MPVVPYRDHEEILRARERELREELASTVAGIRDADARRRDVEAELRRIRSLLQPKDPASGLLERVQIASPCGERWEDMSGDERSRFCARCGKNVYDVSGMAREEAEQFLVRNTDACLRLYRRADGTVLTSDCPEGARRRRVRVFLRQATVVAVGLAAGAAIAEGAKALVHHEVVVVDEAPPTMGF